MSKGISDDPGMMPGMTFLVVLSLLFFAIWAKSCLDMHCPEVFSNECMVTALH
jgi:hypothetical protein